MNWRPLEDWLASTNLLVLTVGLLIAMCLAAGLGALFSSRRRESNKDDDDGDSYIVSAVLGLLALLLGFTFSLALDRFEARRLLVLDEANAIGTTYLRAQLLTEPHRARMSQLLVRYTENRLVLAKARPRSAEQARAMTTNDALLTDVWAATSASFESIKGLDFSSTYLDSVNAVVDLDAARKAARAARVPFEVFAVLFVYLVTTAGVLGYVLQGIRGRLAAGVLLALLTLSLILIVDLNRPVGGGIYESQKPMEDLYRSLTSQSPAAFDKWRTGDQQ